MLVYMTQIMKTAYRMYRRKRTGVYYIQNNRTREQQSLATTDRGEAKRILDAKNQEQQTPALNLQLGKAFITNADPKMGTRTWQEAMDELSSHGKQVSQSRSARALKSTAFDTIRKLPIALTTTEDLKAVLKRSGAAANNYLRRLHNLALENGWIQWHIIAPKKWPQSAKQPKRGITFEEHQKIVAAEQNDERRLYYEMLWLIGAAQTDCALLSVERNVNWQERVLSYMRRKTEQWSYLKIGKELESLLSKLPKQGFLFPKIAAATVQDMERAAKDRSAEFCRRCRILGIKGVSLHSYRYAWAERAYSAGYEERFAQAALGHKSSAVHHGYAKRAKVICPPLEHESSSAAPELPELTDVPQEPQAFAV
jgi:integrase